MIQQPHRNAILFHQSFYHFYLLTVIAFAHSHKKTCHPAAFPPSIPVTEGKERIRAHEQVQRIVGKFLLHRAKRIIGPAGTPLLYFITIDSYGKRQVFHCPLAHFNALRRLRIQFFIEWLGRHENDETGMNRLPGTAAEPDMSLMNGIEGPAKQDDSFFCSIIPAHAAHPFLFILRQTAVCNHRDAA